MTSEEAKRCRGYGRAKLKKVEASVSAKPGNHCPHHNLTPQGQQELRCQKQSRRCQPTGDRAKLAAGCSIGNKKPDGAQASIMYREHVLRVQDEDVNQVAISRILFFLFSEIQLESDLQDRVRDLQKEHAVKGMHVPFLQLMAKRYAEAAKTATDRELVARKAKRKEILSDKVTGPQAVKKALSSPA